MKLWVDPWAGLKFPGVVGNRAAGIKVSSESEVQHYIGVHSKWLAAFGEFTLQIQVMR